MSELEKVLSEPMEAGSHGPVPETLTHLFNKDPLDLSTQDLEAIVVTLRAQREAFLQEESSSKTAGTKPNYKKSGKAAAQAVDISKIEF